MPKESTNLKLKLYNVLTDAKEFALDWFNNIFDYSNSNWVKIDDAYKELKDNFDNYPLKDGTGATGDWDINAKSATNDNLGQQIDSTYIKDLTPTGDKIIITKGNNETTTIDGAAPKGYILTEKTETTTTGDNHIWFHVGTISNTSDSDVIKINLFNSVPLVNEDGTSVDMTALIDIVYYICDLKQIGSTSLLGTYSIISVSFVTSWSQQKVQTLSNDSNEPENAFFIIPTSGGDGTSSAEVWLYTDPLTFRALKITVEVADKDNWTYVLKEAQNGPSLSDNPVIYPNEVKQTIFADDYATGYSTGVVQIGDNITVDNSGVISVTKDNVSGALGYEPVEKTVLTSIAIPTTGWSQDDNSAYPNYIDITATGITTSDCIALVIAPSSNAVAKKCYFAATEALADKIRVRARNIPTEAIKAFYYVIREDILMSFGQTPIGGAILPPATTTELGGVIVGDGLKVDSKGVLSSDAKIPEVDKLTAYPVGSIFQTVDNTSPAALFGGTWEQIASNRVLMGVDKGNTKPGTTVSAGLPNITGSLYETRTDSSPFRGSGNVISSTGALAVKEIATSYGGYSRYGGSSYDISFNASKSNAIYGRSDTVQPAAYYVYIWRRIS